MYQLSIAGAVRHLNSGSLPRPEPKSAVKVPPTNDPKPKPEKKVVLKEHKPKYERRSRPQLRKDKEEVEEKLTELAEETEEASPTTKKKEVRKKIDKERRKLNLMKKKLVDFEVNKPQEETPDDKQED